MKREKINEEHYRKLERMYLAAPINAFFRPSVVIGQGEADITMEVRPDFFHAARAVHGAAYFKILDDSCFFAVQSLVEDAFVLTASFTSYIERPVTEGSMRALGRVVMASRNLFIAEARVLDHLEREVARGSGNFVRSRMTLGADIGYV
jgi:uncharacterized protein (TIGR00369 family)